MSEENGGNGRCNARARHGGPCRNSAGFKTSHAGVGKCLHHGGASLVRHGRYSAIKRESLRALIEQYESDPDPLNILPELAAMRALFQDYIERYAGEFKDGTEYPTAVQILDRVGRMVERIEKARSQNAISQPELYRVMAEMARVVEIHVGDPQILAKVQQGWLDIRVRPNAASEQRN